MKLRIPFLTFLFLFALVAQAQEVSWAAKVEGFSSQFDGTQWSAKQILGKPDVLPQFKDSPCSWSPRKEENRLPEWIKVKFLMPIQARQIAIAESHNPGAISHIYFYDEKGKEHEIYSNKKTQAIPDRGRMFIHTFSLTKYKVVAAKVVLNTLDVPGWNHLDAIGISDSEEPIEARINVAENLEFKSKPQNLGTGINSRYDEIMPVISPDGKTLYFDRKDHPENAEGKINDDIWFGTVSENGFWSTAVNVGPPLNNDGHNFLSAITPDGNTVLLGNVYESDGSMASGLSISTMTEDGWAFPKQLQIIDYYNRNKYSEFHMGADGKTIVMAIQRDNTQGVKDIYVSFRLDNNMWSEPRNLGPEINSAGTEMSPFLAADGQTLYFSSNGHPGYGSNDMFLSRRLDDSWQKWTEPQNLGPMINSPNWDAYYSVPASGEFGYFSSENHSIGKTDIFRISLPEEIRPKPVVLLMGRVFDKVTKKPIQAEIFYETLPDGKEAGIAISSPVTGEYKIVLPAGFKYGIRAKAPMYLSVNENFDYTEVDEYKELTKDLYLVPMKKGETVVMNNIFFSPSSSDLTPESYPELDRIIEFLDDNSSIFIEVSGHTNNSCTEEWCKKLSTARAKSVANYLIRNGIGQGRITYKGYGSRRPIANNETAEGKRKNRRVEFTILEL